MQLARISALVLTLSFAVSAVPAPAVAATAGDGAPAVQLRLDEDAAIQLAEQDPIVRMHLSLRDVDYRARAQAVAATSVDPLLGGRAEPGWVVEWYDDGEFRLEAFVADDDGVVSNVGGQSLNVMPLRPPTVFERTGGVWHAVVPGVVFALLLVLGPATRTWRRAIAPPLLVLAAAHVVMVGNYVSAAHVRTGALALFGAAAAALLVGALAWTRAATWPDEEPACVRVPTILSLLLVAAAFALQGWYVHDARVIIDVGFASYAGASLLAGGVTPYGNILDIPGFLYHGDTYGPIAYLAYAPAASVGDVPATAVLWTNLVLSACVAAVVFARLLVTRDVRTAAWAAAAWSTCPLAIGAVLAGGNDVVVALAIAGVVVVVGSPLLRGCMVAIAAATKLLPAVLLAFLLRLRGETRSAVPTLAGFTATSVAVWVVGFGGVEGVGSFVDAVAFQQGRDDIASIWGLLGIGSARYVVLAAAAALGAWSIVRGGRDDARGALLRGCAAIALVLLALPQYWGTYVAWLLPPLLVVGAAGAVRSEAATEPAVGEGPATVPGDASAGRRAGALPSSSAP